MPVDVTTLTPFSETHLTVRLVVGVVILIGALGLAAWRGLRILTVIRSGQPAVGRTDEVGVRLQAEATEVLGQKKLLKWKPSGIAHFFTFWGFIILGLTIIEAFGALFDPDGCKLYPEGSYFTVPGNAPHYGYGKTGDAVYQESGVGPSAFVPVAGAQ